MLTMMMSFIKPKFVQAANVLCHVSVSNSNAFSLFLKVLRDMSVGCRSCGRVFENDGTINRETTSSVSCPRAWHKVLT